MDDATNFYNIMASSKVQNKKDKQSALFCRLFQKKQVQWKKDYIN